MFGPSILVLVFCLSGSPTTCQEIRPIPQAMSMGQCFTSAQEEAAKWVGDHPKWRLKAFRCMGERDPRNSDPT